MDDALGGLLLLGIAILVVVYIIIPGTLLVVSLTASVGAVTGGGVSLYNYVLAFKDNIKPERVTP